MPGTYGLVVADECHRVPAAAFEHVVKQIPARRWLGLTATPYRRDQLDDLIGLYLGPTRHTISAAPAGTLSHRSPELASPEPVLHVHQTAFVYTGTREPSAPGGMADVYRELATDTGRNQQIITDVLAALDRGRNCLVLTRWTSNLERLDEALRAHGHDAVILRGGLGVKALVPPPGKTTAEVHDYHDVLTGILASSLAKRAPGYRKLGFPDPRRR